MDKLDELLEANTPSARLARHRELWGDDPPPDVAQMLQTIAQRLETTGKAGTKGLALLKQLDARVLLDTYLAPKRSGGTNSAGERGSRSVKVEQAILKEWDKLTREKKPESERIRLILLRTGFPRSTVIDCLNRKKRRTPKPRKKR